MIRVAITGMGVISAIGQNIAEFAESLRRGRPGIRPIASLDTSNIRFHNGAEVRDAIPAVPGLDRFAQFALIAAREAVAEAGIDWTLKLKEETAVITGTSIGGQSTQDSAFDTLYAQRLNRLHPLSVPRTMPNAGASHISIEFGVQGPCFTIASACSSAAHAIGHAFRMVRQATH